MERQDENSNWRSADTDTVVARIEIPMEQNAFFFPMFYEDKTIVAESSMRTERYNGFYDSNLN